MLSRLIRRRAEAARRDIVAAPAQAAPDLPCFTQGELAMAIDAGEIIPYYQPIVRLPSTEIAKFEVLARWRHPRLGLLKADTFIPAAVEMGLASKLTMSLLRQVGIDSESWPSWCRFALNISADQLRALIDIITAQHADWRQLLVLDRLDVELTNNAVLRDRELVRELIDVLHAHGARAGLDNFGNGLSNLSLLRDLAFDSLKISSSFIHAVLDEPRAEACLVAMLWLGHSLGMDMVAEGVTRQEEADRLVQLGCNFAQGFLFARPMPAREVGLLFGAGGSGSTHRRQGVEFLIDRPVMLAPLWPQFGEFHWGRVAAVA
jgi:EAL domain-containing protein (putative c-di-GMP-specific phosphodiesterase class I)